MLHRSKLLLAALCAAILLALAISSATGGRLAISNANFRFTWGLLSFTIGEWAPISCPVTLEGSFHSRTIRKVSRALIGHVSRATFNSAACTGGSPTVNQTSLPWHVKYMGFTGVLPNIWEMELLLDGLAFEIENGFGVVCSWSNEANNPADFIATREAGGAISGVRAREGGSVPVSGLFCPTSGRFSGGIGSVTLLGATTRITVTLI